MIRLALLTCWLTVLSTGLCSAQPENRVSPLSVVTSRYKDTYLKIVYSQPHKNDRELFGSLVPYGKVWRTGANEATEITVTRDIKVNDKDLKAGTYSLFTIPDEGKWTIIFNLDQGLWGSYNYNELRDVFRFEVPVTETDRLYEAFTIAIDSKNEAADISLMWGNTKVSFPIHYLEPKPKP